MNKRQIIVKNLKKNFWIGSGEVAVLKGIELELAPSEMVVIVGKSGAGKSTLLHVVGTLERPTSGEILFDGKSVFGNNDRNLSRFRNQNIGFVFQMHHLLPEFTAVENVMMPAIISGMSKSEAYSQAIDLLKLTGVFDRADHRPGELSGGEQQRIAISRALILKPSVVLADEPTGNLDTETGSRIHDLFFEINDRLKSTIIVVTHNETLANRFPRMVQLKDGKVV